MGPHAIKSQMLGNQCQLISQTRHIQLSQNKRKQEIKKPCMIEQLKCMHAWVEPLTQVYSLSFNKLLPDEAGFVMAIKKY